MVDYKTLEDYGLICECIRGDQVAFEELVFRYKNLVYSLVVRMVNDREDANDLAQEVFIKVYKNLDKYSTEFKFSTWIMRITTNHVIDFRRKKKQDFVPLDEIPYEVESWETPEKVLIEKERNTILAEALGNLPEMYRVPIVMFHQQGLSYQEISDVLGEPLSKVKNRIFRARKMLKDYLTESKAGVIYEM